MRYSALEIARYVINYCINTGSPISNLQLQKILYFLQGEYYEKTGTVLFDDEMCAWKFGPVVPDVYYEFCAYGGSPILNRYQLEINPDDEDVINNTIDKYKGIPVWQLVEKTHEVGSPWFQIFNSRGDRAPIPKALICDYFSK